MHDNCPADQSAREHVREEDAAPEALAFVLVLPKRLALDFDPTVHSDKLLGQLPVEVHVVHIDQTSPLLGLVQSAQRNELYSTLVGDFRSRLLQIGQCPGNLYERIEVEGIIIDPLCYTVWCLGKSQRLTPLEFRLLHYLAARPNRVFSRDELLLVVRSSDRVTNARLIDVYIRRLRVKIEPDPEHPIRLKTLHRVGYLFEGKQ